MTINTIWEGGGVVFGHPKRFSRICFGRKIRRFEKLEIYWSDDCLPGHYYAVGVLAIRRNTYLFCLVLTFYTEISVPKVFSVDHREKEGRT